MGNAVRDCDAKDLLPAQPDPSDIKRAKTVGHRIVVSPRLTAGCFSNCRGLLS